jgi:hypothetical protein
MCSISLKLLLFIAYRTLFIQDKTRKSKIGYGRIPLLSGAALIRPG